MSLAFYSTSTVSFIFFMFTCLQYYCTLFVFIFRQLSFSLFFLPSFSLSAFSSSISLPLFLSFSLCSSPRVSFLVSPSPFSLSLFFFLFLSPSICISPSLPPSPCFSSFLFLLITSSYRFTLYVSLFFFYVYFFHWFSLLTFRPCCSIIFLLLSLFFHSSSLFFHRSSMRGMLLVVEMLALPFMFEFELHEAHDRELPSPGLLVSTCSVQCYWLIFTARPLLCYS